MTVLEKNTVERHSSFYKNNYDHIQDELRKLDMLLRLRILRFRQTIQDMPEAARSRHLFISDEEADWLLSQKDAASPEQSEIRALNDRIEKLQRRIDRKVGESLEKRIPLALHRLACLFGLSAQEVQIIVLCLAPELDRKYDKLYAYLQDDITRKRPSVDLALDILCESGPDRVQARGLLGHRAPLLRAGILQAVDDPLSPSGSSDLARLLKLDRRILNYLLMHDGMDERLQGVVTFVSPSPDIQADPAISSELARLIQQHLSSQNGRRNLIVHLHGPFGAGKRSLAVEVCRQLGCPLLMVDMDMLPQQDMDAETVLRAVFREGVLLQAPLYLGNAEAVFREEDKAMPFLKKLNALMTEFGWLAFLAGEQALPLRQGVENSVIHAMKIPVPDVSRRKLMWEQMLKTDLPGADTAWAGRLAAQFRITPGRMQSAIAWLKSKRDGKGPEKDILLADLHEACRKQTDHRFSELALKIAFRYTWEDIVLPEAKIAQLKEICGHVKHQYRVFSEWGFGKKLAHGKGLSVLFSGPPGTGKTMAADVMAGELRLDLYKIDLSGVVSKYIGETEKNLNKIFREAEMSNAVLFFDEADALFGKRTKVSDAHDRYANIETSFLLQKMEEYEGMVILATNLRENMDDAFVRRIRFIVEFPFPDETCRRDIWEAHFTSDAPVSADIDYGFLSRRFQIAGGNIKNIALNAAFLAAENGGLITMEHIVRAGRREYEKIGKIWDERSFSGLTRPPAETLSAAYKQASNT